MQDVTVRCTAGPMKGFVGEFEVGQLIIGRQPGARGLELKGAGGSVSRQHVELIDKDGIVILRNLSPNGTTVGGKLIVDEVQVRSGATIEIGGKFRLDLEWQTFGAETIVRKNTVSTPVAKQGPLASPVVRAVIGVYMAGMGAVGIWFALAGDDSLVAADEWPAIEAAYQIYAPEVMDESEHSARMARAEFLVSKLRIQRTQRKTDDVDRICRELMSLDGDAQSPLFQYGARCLAAR